MNTDLKKACEDCPFRCNSLKGWLGPWESAEELHRFVMHSEKPLACHNTVRSPEDYHDLSGQDEPLSESLIDDLIEYDSSVCFGSLLYLKQAGKLPRQPVLLKALETTVGALRSNILTVPQFHAHHSNRIPHPTS